MMIMSLTLKNFQIQLIIYSKENMLKYMIIFNLIYIIKEMPLQIFYKNDYDWFIMVDTDESLIIVNDT